MEYNSRQGAAYISDLIKFHLIYTYYKQSSPGAVKSKIEAIDITVTTASDIRLQPCSCRLQKLENILKAYLFKFSSIKV